MRRLVLPLFLFACSPAATPPVSTREPAAPANKEPSAKPTLPVDAGAAPLAAAATVDLSFLRPTDGLEVVASTDTKLLAVVHAGMRDEHARRGLDGILEAPRGLVIEDGCVRAVVKVPSSVTVRYGLVASSAAAAVDADGVRQDFADLHQAFASMRQRAYQQQFAWADPITLSQGVGMGPTLWVQRGNDLRKLTLATKVVSDVAVLEDGTAYVGLGFSGQRKLARVDLGTGALAPVPLASVEDMLAIAPSTLLVVRYDTGKRATCLEKLPTSGPSAPLACVAGKPAHYARLTLSSGNEYAAFAVEGKRVDTTHVVELATGRVVQHVDDSAAHPALSRTGSIALQSMAGPGPIVVGKGGVSSKSTATGVLAGFNARDELVVLDEAALKRGQTCNVTHVVSN